MEKIADAETSQNKTLPSAKEYRNSSSENAYFERHSKMKHVIDTMPLFTMIAADKIEEKTLDITRTATLSSIKGKLNQTEHKTIQDIIEYVKMQKKDGLYD